MAGHYHNGMDLLSEKDVERIYHVTDQLQLHRDWVVVPLGCVAEAFEIVQPDGKLLMRPPGGELFEPWFDGLASRLSELDLTRTARLGTEDPLKPHFPRARGTRGYLEGPRKAI
ncbi:MAG TPA: hypothetical protein VKU80_07010 [Planctomycetota bacterium]|nr:hypothetical protein [Planctomycetota bacterium]